MERYPIIILGDGVASQAAAIHLENELGRTRFKWIRTRGQFCYHRPGYADKFTREEVRDLQRENLSSELFEKTGVFYRLKSTPPDPAPAPAAIDFGARIVELVNGEQIGFDKMILSPGSSPEHWPIPGSTLHGVFPLRSLMSPGIFRDIVSRNHRAVVLGRGLMELEVASVLAQRGLQVTLIFPDERLLDGMLTDEVSAYFQGLFQAHSVNLVSQIRLKSIEGNDHLQKLILEGRHELPADVLIVSTPSRPDLGLCRGGDLDHGEGLKVNEYLETNRTGIFAVGETVEYRDLLFDKFRRLRQCTDLILQGVAAARNASGRPIPFTLVPCRKAQIFEHHLEFWGDTEGADQVIYRGNIGRSCFSGWWLAQGRVISALTVNRPGTEQDMAREMIRSRRVTSPIHLLEA